MSDALLPPMSAELRWLQWGARVLALLGVLLLLASALLWAVRRPALEWRQIRIEGEVSRNHLATLRANALPRLSGNFVTMDLARTRAAFEAVPWVRRATVRRVWPGQLRVTLQEHQPLAYWDGRGDRGEAPAERALLNAQGEVFHANLGEVEDEALPELAGPHGSEALVLALWQQLVALPLAEDGARPVRLELSGRGSWRATWASGAVVELGRGSPEQLAQRYREFLPHALAVAQRFQTQVQSADLRHAQGYALKLVGISTAPTARNTPKRKP